ncbi:MAG: VacJ family lipoprotein [Holosporales bacterium]|jgi:phospholipid-binding lipoprotein MlaA|nr:VacJ family lipoprotein [Holosporales bacterium]
MASKFSIFHLRVDDRNSRVHVGKKSLTRRLLFSFALSVAGCSPKKQPVSLPISFFGVEDKDPYEKFNRAVFKFNVALDDYVLESISAFYGAAFPSLVKSGVRNEITNLKQPLSFINYAIAGDEKSAAQSMARFFTNLFFGFFGLVDVYKELSPSPPPTELSFDGALAKRKVRSGPYIMAPFLGPSSPRGIIGLVFDSFADPIYFIPKPKNRTSYSLTRYALDQIGGREKVLKAYKQTKAEALDLYSLVRSIYWQKQKELEGAPSNSGSDSAEDAPIPYDEDDE